MARRHNPSDARLIMVGVVISTAVLAGVYRLFF